MSIKGTHFWRQPSLFSGSFPSTVCLFPTSDQICVPASPFPLIPDLVSVGRDADVLGVSAADGADVAHPGAVGAALGGRVGGGLGRRLHRPAARPADRQRVAHDVGVHVGDKTEIVCRWKYFGQSKSPV